MPAAVQGMNDTESGAHTVSVSKLAFRQQKLAHKQAQGVRGEVSLLSVMDSRGSSLHKVRLLSKNSLCPAFGV